MFSFSQGPRWHIDLQPWAGPAQSLDEEALRFLSYISTTQVVFHVQGGLEMMQKIPIAPFEEGWVSEGAGSPAGT